MGRGIGGEVGGIGRVEVTVHVPSNGICRGFAFKYGKFLLPPRFLTALPMPDHS